MLTYNLIRQSLLQSTAAGGHYPHQLSFTAAVQMLTTTWLIAAHAATPLQSLVLLRLASGGSHRVGLRPDRVEPRAIKRRKSSYKLLRVPRAAARVELLRP